MQFFMTDYKTTNRHRLLTCLTGQRYSGYRPITTQCMYATFEGRKGHFLVNNAQTDIFFNISWMKIWPPSCWRSLTRPVTGEDPSFYHVFSIACRRTMHFQANAYLWMNEIWHFPIGPVGFVHWTTARFHEITVVLYFLATIRILFCSSSLFCFLKAFSGTVHHVKISWFHCFYSKQQATPSYRWYGLSFVVIEWKFSAGNNSTVWGAPCTASFQAMSQRCLNVWPSA